MSKTLVIVIHPDIEHSMVNKRWIAALEEQPEKYTVHQLYKTYPDSRIDVGHEQQLVEAHQRIIFQFPLYWFSCPPLLKQWLDEVLTYGWAYGSKSGYKVGGKKIALAISAGIDDYEYAHGQKYKYTLEELTRPFEITFEYVHANYQPLFAYYGIERNPSEEWVEKSVPLYLAYLEKFGADE